jgi:hypothetical protein
MPFQDPLNVGWMTSSTLIEPSAATVTVASNRSM